MREHTCQACGATETLDTPVYFCDLSQPEPWVCRACVTEGCVIGWPPQEDVHAQS